MTLPSREAIEAAYRIHYGVGCSFLETQQIIEAAYAIDVAPLLAWVEELEALPKLKDCLFHRCSKHYKVQQLNANEPCGSECGACVGEELTVERDRLKEENASLKTFLSAAFQEGEETRKRLEAELAEAKRLLEQNSVLTLEQAQWLEKAKEE